MIFKDHTFGDMIARYVKDEHTEKVGLMLLPQRQYRRYAQRSLRSIR
jgi:hypothetical protein